MGKEISIEQKEDRSGFVNLGPARQIPVGQGLCFLIKQRQIAVFRTHSNKFYAIYNRCPHRQGPLAEGIADETEVICPYHGHKFNLKTGQGSEGKERVMTYEIKEENGELLMKTSASLNMI